VSVVTVQLALAFFVWLLNSPLGQASRQGVQWQRWVYSSAERSHNCLLSLLPHFTLCCALFLLFSKCFVQCKAPGKSSLLLFHTTSDLLSGTSSSAESCAPTNHEQPHLFSCLCYKNIHCWHGPYSFFFSSSPSTSIRRTMHAYTCTISSGWSYSHLTFSGYIPFDQFLAHLYHICSPDLRLAPLCPFHFTGTHPIISWAPYLTVSPWHCHPIPLPNLQLMTQSSVTFTVVSVCDSASPLPLPYHRSLTHFLFLYYYLQPGLCLFPSSI